MNPAIGIGASAASALCTWVFTDLARRAGRRRDLELHIPGGWFAAGSAVIASFGTSGTGGVAFGAALAGAVVCAASDWECGLIFDEVSLASLLATIVAAGWSGRMFAALGGAALVAATLAALHVATHGKGLGLGDVKLSASIGAALGIFDGLAALAVAFVVGGAYGLVLIAARRARRGATIRFAPFLAVGLITLGLHPCCR